MPPEGSLARRKGWVSSSWALLPIPAAQGGYLGLALSVLLVTPKTSQVLAQRGLLISEPSPLAQSSAPGRSPQGMKPPVALGANPAALFHFPLNKSIEVSLSGEKPGWIPLSPCPVRSQCQTLSGGPSRGASREIPTGSSPLVMDS